MWERPTAGQVARALLPAVRRLAAGRDRVLLGLAGPPGVGKSVLADEVAAAFSADGLGDAVALGMDGFHLRQVALDRRGLAHVKGAPETFDADGFVALLRRLREAGGEVHAPTFDRAQEEPVPDAVTVTPDHRLVVIEGNYLLLDGPWRPVRDLLDAAWQLHLPDDIRVPVLVDRHVRHGRTPEDAMEWVHRSDEANARLIGSVAHHADAIVDLTMGRLLSAPSVSRE